MSFAFVPFAQRLVVANVILRHSRCGKSFLEMSAHLTPVELGKPSNRLYGLCFAWHDKAGEAIIDNLWHRARAERDHGRPAGHGLDHDETKRLWPIDRKQQRSRTRQKLPFRFIIDLAGELDLGPVDLRLEPFLEIVPFSARHLGCDTKR